MAEGTERGGGLQCQGSESQPHRSPRAKLQIAAVSSPGPSSLPAFRAFWDFLSLLPDALSSAPGPLQPPSCALHRILSPRGRVPALTGRRVHRGQEVGAGAQGSRDRIIAETKTGLTECIRCPALSSSRMELHDNVITPHEGRLQFADVNTETQSDSQGPKVTPFAPEECEIASPSTAAPAPALRPLTATLLPALWEVESSKLGVSDALHQQFSA